MAAVPVAPGRRRWESRRTAAGFFLRLERLEDGAWVPTETFAVVAGGRLHHSPDFWPAFAVLLQDMNSRDGGATYTMLRSVVDQVQGQSKWLQGLERLRQQRAEEGGPHA